MMLCRVLLVGIVLGAQAYAPIQMVSHGIKGLAVLPEGFPRNVQDSVTPQKLVMSNAVESILPSRIPYFSARPDQTITWDDMDWCLEVDGDQRGATARVNKCNGGAAQKWNWIPNGQGSNMLQLKDTNMCLDVRDGHGLVGAPIELRDCGNSETETWAFEDVVAGMSESEARASGMRHVMLSLFALAGVGVLGVSAWFIRWNAKKHTVAFNMDQGPGVALTAPTRNATISMSATLARPEGLTPPTRSSNISMTAGGKPTLHVGIVGYGLVGKKLVQQILDNASSLESELGVCLKVSGVARSKTMAFLDDQSSLSDGAWPSQDEPLDLNKFGQNLQSAAAASGGRAVVVDNTAADTPVEFYEQWLASGMDVATPNKRAGSGPYTRYEKILEASKSGGSSFLYEATVGAGLPIIAPLQSLRRAGDEVKSVEGIFSGTLSYIFNSWKPGTKYSEVVADAKEKGFTEPDPRDDLGGTDVQRKVTILARELGLKLELDDVPVESLVPEKLRDWEPPAGTPLADAFIQELKNYDDEMAALLDSAEAANEVLRFVGAIDMEKGTASVKLGRFPKDHPFASTQFADNIAAFETKWYSPRPLVVQGPGAGAAVTAAGIFGNIMESMKMLR